MPPLQIFNRLVLMSGDPGMQECFASLAKEVVPYNNLNDIKPLSLVVFEGGTDVNPLLYGEPKGKHSSFPDIKRDDRETEVFKFCRLEGIPMLGVCRGSQFLTVMNGGRLVQDVTGHGRTHMMETFDTKQIPVTSTHHQMMFPFGLREEDYLICGWSGKRMSEKYLNGWNESMEPPMVEPEIVFYKETKSLAIQGHPEYLHPSAEFPRYARSLVRRFLMDQE